MRTWEQQREEIQRQITRFFRRKIDVAPRALAAFQVPDVDDDYTEEYPSGFEITILQTLLKSSPACATILFKNGVQLDKLGFPMTRPTPAVLADSSLQWVFKGVEVDRFTATAKRIRACARLEETDILVSALEAATRGPESNAFGDSVLDAAGLARSGHWPGAENDEERLLRRQCNAYLRKLLKGVRELAVVDPDHALLQFVLFEDERKQIRVRPFGATGLSALKEEPPTRQGVRYLYRGGILQPIDSVIPELSEQALGRFEELLNSVGASERDYQQFFEEFPCFLTGLDFRKAHPQPILYQDDGSRLIPDFFLEKFTCTWDAILDLKKPYDEMVRRRPNRVYFKQAVHNAIGQLRYYREWFDSPSNRQWFAEVYGVSTFRPRMVIVMGRNRHFRDDVERIRLLDGLQPQIELWTYDDLLDRASRYLGLWRG